MSNQTFAHLDFYARTTRELFCPRVNTGNPQHDFFTHYSRLHPLQRLSLEQHTINGTQISRFEPDLEHSTCGVNSPGFVSQMLDEAGRIARDAAFLSVLTLTAPMLAILPPVREALLTLDADRLASSERLLEAEINSSGYAPLVNEFAAVCGDAPQRLERSRAVDHAAEVKIAAPEYAARTLGNSEDGAEFIRCLKLIAGADASALYRQQLASHYYAEARRRPVSDVLKEMGLLGLELSAVTASSEQLQFGDALTTESELEALSSADASAEMSPEERRELWEQRAGEVLEDGTSQRASIFSEEMRAQARLVYRKTAARFDYDEFDAHLSDVSAATVDDAEFGAYLDSFERAYEQYDEGFAVSLHMTDGERKIACGDLDDDVDADCLPEAARHLADELAQLYVSGFPLADGGARGGSVEGVLVSTFVRSHETRERVAVPTLVYGIDSWLDAKLDEVFGSRTARTTRRLLTVPDRRVPSRIVTFERTQPRLVSVEMHKRGETIRTTQVRHFIKREQRNLSSLRLHEQTATIEACPNAEERAEARAVLEILMQRLRRDYHARGLNLSAIYRDLTARLSTATCTGVVAGLKREAWQYKQAGQLSFKLFTAFNTHAIAHQARLEATPLREMRSARIVRGDGFQMTQTFTDGAHPFILIQPLLQRIPVLTGRTLGDFALQLRALPRQEQERLRSEFRAGHPQLYARVRDGLKLEILRSSKGRLRYFRWAFYAGNKPEHPIHTLTREDQAAAWELLKQRSAAGIAPLLPFLNRDETTAAAATGAVSGA